MTVGLTLLNTEIARELPVPPIVYGIVGFAVLLALLFVTLAVGKGRPHS